jgi:hypothetical protein
METHAVTTNLEESRARLRELLLPDPETGRIEADVFPRSAVMRFLLNPRGRRMAFTTVSALAMLARRSNGGAGLLPVLTQSLAGLLGTRRR